MLKFRLIASAVCALILSSPAVAQTADKGSIYSTKLENGWQNWSWATTEAGIEIEGSPRRPIRVEADGYEALYLHHDPIALTGFTKLRFLLQGSKPGGKVKVVALSGGKAVNDGTTLELKNNGWTDVQLPLDRLGATDKPIDGFWIQNAGGETLPPFYVTEVKLL